MVSRHDPNTDRIQSAPPAAGEQVGTGKTWPGSEPGLDLDLDPDQELEQPAGFREVLMTVASSRPRSPWRCWDGVLRLIGAKWRTATSAATSSGGRRDEPGAGKRRSSERIRPNGEEAAGGAAPLASEATAEPTWRQSGEHQTAGRQRRHRRCQSPPRSRSRHGSSHRPSAPMRSRLHRR